MGRCIVFSAFYADFCFCSKSVIITTLKIEKLFSEQCWFWSDWQFAQADLNSLFATFIRCIITGRESFRFTTICMDRGVSYRNYLGMCIFVWEPMMNIAHGYVILGGSSWLLTWRKQRKRSVSISELSSVFCPPYLELWLMISNGIMMFLHYNCLP